MLSGKTVIVTGGGRGLGEAAAVHLGELGSTVVVNDLGTSVSGEGESTAPARETLDAVEAAGGDGMVHCGDVASLEYAERLIADTVEEYGRVDGVVNFAGTARPNMSFEMSAEDWDEVIRVHLRGHFALLKHAARHWRRRAEGGALDQQRSFVGVSSVAACGLVGQLNYATAKAGILGLVRSGAIELSEYNVRVNSLLPEGFTRMMEIFPESVQPFTAAEKPPEEVAPMVAFLLSDHAEDVSGRAFRAGGDTIALVSEPDLQHKMAFQEGGWTAAGIADRFDETLGAGGDLQRTEQPDW